MYRIEVTPAAERELNKLKERMHRRDFEGLGVAIPRLASEPRPRGATKLRGEAAYRIRIGRYRVIYDIDDDRALVVILKVVRRSESTYRR